MATKQQVESEVKKKRKKIISEVVPQARDRGVREDLRAIAAGEVGRNELRYLVDIFYQTQQRRIRAASQIDAAIRAEEPYSVIKWVAAQAVVEEQYIQSALDVYTSKVPVGQWARSIVGVGPVIAAGLIAHIDITKAQTAGAIWRFAGLDPTSTWGKGEKRPWNADLKVLCYKLGDSFMKCCNRKGDVYGHIYAERRALETARNVAGEYKEQAAATLKAHPTHAQRDEYEQGRLPEGRILLRARRYAVKLFLSHLHHVMYVVHFKTDPPKPYILTKDEHTHYLAPPNWPMPKEDR